MTFEPKMARIEELLDAGMPPAQAVAVLAISHIALSTLAANCNLLVARGATPEEVQAYRDQNGSDLAAWVMRHIPEATAVAHGIIEARAAVRRDVLEQIG